MKNDPIEYLLHKKSVVQYIQHRTQHTFYHIIQISQSYIWFIHYVSTVSKVFWIKKKQVDSSILSTYMEKK